MREMVKIVVPVMLAPVVAIAILAFFMWHGNAYDSRCRSAGGVTLSNGYALQCIRIPGATRIDP